MLQNAYMRTCSYVYIYVLHSHNQKFSSHQKVLHSKSNYNYNYNVTTATVVGFYQLNLYYVHIAIYVLLAGGLI